ncbi:hypothetical protein BX600DRAFT_450262 [Xylariales sp. PMI_506]|nr:hypothetical protein BX600DRAFT_450262 [Xylariales sp. PMI_506]
MGQRLPPDLVLYFTRALTTFQLSKTTFSVLRSLPSQSQDVAPSPPQHAPRNLIILDSSFNPPTLAHQRMVTSALADERYSPSSSGSSTRILLLLAINNADKAPKPAAFPQRLAMMYIFALDLLAAVGAVSPVADGPSVDIGVTTEPYFHSKSGTIAASDFYRGGASGTASTATAAVAAVATVAPSTATTAMKMEQIYLTGFDTLIRIFDPKYYPGDGAMRRALDPLFSRSRLRVAVRAGADWGSAADQAAYLADLREPGGRLEKVGGRRDWAGRVELAEEEADGGTTEAPAPVVSSTMVRRAVGAGDWEGLRELVSAGVADWIRAERLYVDMSE